MNLRKGDLLQTKSGDWHEVLKVEDNPQYIQQSTGMSIQSNGDGISEGAVYIWDGYFMNKRSFEEVNKLYIEKKSEWLSHVKGFKKWQKKMEDTVSILEEPHLLQSLCDENHCLTCEKHITIAVCIPCRNRYRLQSLTDAKEAVMNGMPKRNSEQFIGHYMRKNGNVYCSQWNDCLDRSIEAINRAFNSLMGE